MTPSEQLNDHKAHFAEMLELPNAGHKLIQAASALRALYPSLSDIEKIYLLNWVGSVSSLGSYITGEDQNYYTTIAVIKKGLRRANVEHLAKYSSEDVGLIETGDSDSDEYTFNIWKTELIYIQTFLNQYDIQWRVLQCRDLLNELA